MAAEVTAFDVIAGVINDTVVADVVDDVGTAGVVSVVAVVGGIVVEDNGESKRPYKNKPQTQTTHPAA